MKTERLSSSLFFLFVVVTLIVGFVIIDRNYAAFETAFTYMFRWHFPR